MTEMKESEQELHEGAQTLECTMRGVLQEQHLEKFISPQHWKSLMNGPNQVDGSSCGAQASLAQDREGASHRSSSRSISCSLL